MFKTTGLHFGLEQEFFFVQEDPTDERSHKFVLPTPTIPRDNAGYLVEARGDPFRDPINAVFSLKASIYRIESRLPSGSSLFSSARQKLPLRLITESMRKYGVPKKDKTIRNLYDEELTDEQLEWQYAGIHINISNIKYDPQFKAFTTEAFDHVPIIKFLDKRFEKEITEAHRLCGSYSIKELNGGMGLEYRSLPTTVSHDEIVKALNDLLKELRGY